MKASEILRKAAEMVLISPVGGCYAIYRACGWDEYVGSKRRANEYYGSLFKNAETFWFGDPINYTGRAKTKNQNHRALALLLTADIAESVGD